MKPGQQVKHPKTWSHLSAQCVRHDVPFEMPVAGNRPASCNWHINPSLWHSFISALLKRLFYWGLIFWHCNSFPPASIAVLPSKSSPGNTSQTAPSFFNNPFSSVPGLNLALTPLLFSAPWLNRAHPATSAAVHPLGPIQVKGSPDGCR